MPDITREMTREQREAMRQALKDKPSFEKFVVDHWTETKLRVDELRALLDAADERDELRKALLCIGEGKARFHVDPTGVVSVNYVDPTDAPL